jgi:hypothetical protein
VALGRALIKEQRSDKKLGPLQVAVFEFSQ